MMVVQGRVGSMWLPCLPLMFKGFQIILGQGLFCCLQDGPCVTTP